MDEVEVELELECGACNEGAVSGDARTKVEVVVGWPATLGCCSAAVEVEVAEWPALGTEVEAVVAGALDEDSVFASQIKLKLMDGACSAAAAAAPAGATAAAEDLDALPTAGAFSWSGITWCSR